MCIVCLMVALLIMNCRIIITAVNSTVCASIMYRSKMLPAVISCRTCYGGSDNFSFVIDCRFIKLGTCDSTVSVTLFVPHSITMGTQPEEIGGGCFTR